MPYHLTTLSPYHLNTENIKTPKHFHLSPFIPYLLYPSLALLSLWWLLYPLPASALSISPLRQFVAIDPGGSQVVEVQVSNDTLEKVTVFPIVEAFTVDEKTGRPSFGVEDEALRWVEVERRALKLKPGEIRELSFTIRAPEKAEPGGHYLGLFAAQQPGEGQVGIGGRVGSLLFLQVAGEVREELARQFFAADRRLYTKPPLKFSLGLKNTGTIHLLPAGGIILANWRGEEVARMPLNPNQRSVLPDLGWQSDYVFNNRLQARDIGPITATLYIQYGGDKQLVIDQVTVWYAPYVAMVMVGTVLFGGLLVVVRWLWRRMKSR